MVVASNSKHKTRSVATKDSPSNDENTTSNLPTNSPILPPSNSPTMHPSTASPSTHPTFTPSNIPSTYPSAASSNNLTTYTPSYQHSLISSPTTISPSNAPSRDLSIALTNDLTTHTPSNIHPSISSPGTMSPSKRVSPTTMESDLVMITIVKIQHETLDDFITVILVIASVVLCCISVLCITAIYIMYKYKEKHKNKHHDESKVDMCGVYKVDNINNLMKNQSSNIVNLDDSGCLKNNDVPIPSILSTAITKRETFKTQHDRIRVWLEIISFPQYFNNFVLSGYDSIEFIKEIQNELELQEIGIGSKSECNEILCEIEKLRMNVIHEMKDGEKECEIVDVYNIKVTDFNMVSDQDNKCMQNEGKPENVQINNA